jgi:GTP-binding protein SAR1
MFILNFFKDILGYLGLSKKNAKILFLGLDNAGKTTLLRRLKDDRMVQHDPTVHAHAEELVLGGVRFKAYDLGGHQAARKTWKNYFPTVNGVIYMVDASDKERFDESKKELDGILSTPELAKVPIVILGNKIDKKEACSEDDIRNVMGLATKTQFGTQKINEIDGRPVEVFMCSVAKKMGYAEGFRWLSQFLK